ncbi:MAG: hypothetical protein MZU79_03340 [Anaerotruncus sp.]|nr:hypothetical protein [Anaerotruncus sp.]
MPSRERLQAELTLSEASYESARLKAAELSIGYNTASQTAQAASKSAVKHEMRAMELEADLSRMHVLLTRANEDLSGQFAEG